MIPVAYPYISDAARRAVAETLSTRWIGQGPKVDQFEVACMERFRLPHACAVNSGTSALELAYDLIGIGPGDEVIIPVLGCMATTVPIIRRGAKVVFADIRRDTLTIDRDDVLRKVSEDTRAVVSVSLHGVIPDVSEIEGASEIHDAAQAFGSCDPRYRFTAYSFQAIKQVTTGDGGMLVCSSQDDDEEARLRRWFGIDRAKKQECNWEPFNERDILTYDIDYPGYKFQMTDIAASMGLAHLAEYDQIMAHRKAIFEMYRAAGLPLVDGPKNYYCYACLLVEDRPAFRKHLADCGIETSIMHVRNDRYAVAKQFKTECPNMDWVESRYVCIPLHNHMSLSDAHHIAESAREALSL